MQFAFLGPPGAGKGTQAGILAARLQIPHISTGDIFREAIASEDPLGIQVRDLVRAGELVPDDLVMDLMRRRFGRPDIKQGWILDGFPRTIAQARALDRLLSIVQQPHPTVVCFDVSAETAIARMLARGRSDDREDAIRRRLDVYRKDTAPLVDFYRRRQRLVAVNGNFPVEEVTYILQESLPQLVLLPE